ncbi:unnamed protein product [Caretta caretta]
MGSQLVELQGCLEAHSSEHSGLKCADQMQLCHHPSLQEEELSLLSCDKPSSSLVLAGAVSPLVCGSLCSDC